MEVEGTPSFNAVYAAGAMADMFKILFAVLIFAFTGNSSASHPARSVEAADRAAIKAVLDAHGAAWTRGDVAAATASHGRRRLGLRQRHNSRWPSRHSHDAQ